MRICVVGAGASGLACAFRLREAGAEAVLFEARDRPGGWVSTEEVEGFLCERGPTALRGPGPEKGLLARLGLSERIVPASSRARARYIVRNGALVPAPLGPVDLIRTPLLSTRAKLRLLLEPLVRRRRADQEEDESVEAFLARRFGRGAARLADPIVSGVFAGDASRLSLQSAFPALARWEREAGSVVRGIIGSGGSGKKLYGFPGGLVLLPRTLAEALGQALRLGETITEIERAEDGGWRVAGEHWDGLVLAIPSRISAELLRPVDARLAELLEEIPYVPVNVASLAWPRSAFRRPPEGFGFLVPRDEGLRTLGCLFESSLFPFKSPDDSILVRAMAGGAHDPGVADEPPEEVAADLEEEVRELLGAREPGRVVWTAGYRDCLPQYVLGHGKRLAAVEERLERLPRLRLTGNSYRGVSVPECLADGEEAAYALLGTLTK